MSTQLNVASVVDVAALTVLAGEFREQFEASAAVINERLVGRSFIFNRDGKEAYPFEGWEGDSEGEAQPIAPSSQETTISSTDSSCILLGETSDGAVYAVRAAVCFSSRGSVQGYFRIGPIVVHLSPSGSLGLPSELEGYELRVALSDHLIAERMIRNSVEKRILASLLSFGGSMVVVADGSLKHPLDTFPESLLGRGLSGSPLVGFSKTSAMISSNRLSALVSRAPGPAYSAVVDGLVPTLLAKFSRDGLVFRLDVARAAGCVEETLGRMLANDSFSAGYPESLRVAHHLSVFSRSEDMALKAYIANRYSLKQLRSFGLRRMALGGLSNSG